MATTYSHVAFGTLAYAHALALAVVTRDFVMSSQATNDFVDKTVQDAKNELKTEIDKVRAGIKSEIDKIRVEIDKVRIELKTEIKYEISSRERRMTMTMGKLIAFAVGVMLAGIPIIQVLIGKPG